MTKYVLLRSIRPMLLLILTLVVWCNIASAQGVMVLEEGKGELISRSEMISNVFIADPSLADVSIADDGSIFIFAKQSGETSLIATGEDGSIVIEQTLRVIPNLAELRSSVSRLYPSAAVVFGTSRGQLVVRGVAPSEVVRAGVIQTAEAFVKDSIVVDQIQVSSSNIVRLNVKLYELQGNKTRTRGVNNLSISGSGLTIAATPSNSAEISLSYDESTASDPAKLLVALQLLETNGLVSLIENTTIATVIGEPATLTVGGQFPVPVGGTLDTTEEDPVRRTGVEYRFFGTKMLFKPEVAAGGKIRLTVDSEISNPASTTSEVDGNILQNFVTRSVSSKVELKDGEPFLLAGLSRDLSRLSATRPSRAPLSRVAQSIFGRSSVSEDSLNLLLVLTPLYSEPPVEKKERVSTRGNLQHLFEHRGKKLSRGVTDVRGFGFTY
ncbi:pilus assembly protein N-terminal domain-containing protein [uncultured Tateyamaria sp.]|uniref:pilus assembly protein N-terminal domain-containing protein n=1 Tax=uncultured Tateyamaria sp. TaxID=455651 RepID=UPI00262F6C94|nr:pilus assembly protein N-terminal domain-containing protein [uncultured Tateyamaria sp.]